MGRPAAGGSCHGARPPCQSCPKVFNQLALISSLGFLTDVPKGSPQCSRAHSVKPSLKQLEPSQVRTGPGKRGFCPERNQGCVCCSVRDQMMVWSPAVEKYFHPALPINNSGQPVKINVSTPWEPNYLKTFDRLPCACLPSKMFSLCIFS